MRDKNAAFHTSSQALYEVGGLLNFQPRNVDEGRGRRGGGEVAY